MNKQPRILSVYRCARCGTDHANLPFTQFSIPIVENDETVWDWWAICPNTGDPILMRDVSEQEVDESEKDTR